MATPIHTPAHASSAPTLTPEVAPGPVSMFNSRKFKALMLAIVVYGVPMVMTFVLVLTKHAKFDDFKEMVKWGGLSLSPAFLGYIGGTALESMGSNRKPNVMVQTNQPASPPSET